MKISICGDVCPIGTNELWIKNDKQQLFHDVPKTFLDSDRVIVNLETSLTDGGTPIKKFGPNLKASPKCANVLKEIGVTDCAISNNHIFDLGIEGVQDTLKALEDAGLNHIGFGNDYEDARKNLIINKDGKSVSVIAVCEHEYSYALKERMGARPFDPFDTIEDIQNAKKTCDFVIVLYHGGKEQSEYPSPRLRKACQAMIKQGADVVLCQHSHCIGCYEQFQNGHILYGQGNFHFVERNIHPHWQSGVIVELHIAEKLEIEFVPVKVVKNGIELAKYEDKETILKGLEARSKGLQTEEWLEGWRSFCKEKEEEYISTIRAAYLTSNTSGAEAKFSHYLYCEAHRDVWEELCKLSWETRTTP